MRQRWIYPADGEPFEVTADYVHVPEGHFVMGDLPAYESPVDGRVIEGRAQRREDLRRTGCRPWEGREQETKEAQRRKAYQEQHLEKRAEEHAWRSYYQLSPEKRRILRGA
jgi:hypothetical protein